ncbi:MAG: GDP-mannose 4,6-dehydratase [Candidatus Pelagibacter sp. TMED64]|nr:GDP-mannose 4,6-dehydratase [Candidatus Pelagibacter sp.]OUU66361.1 MAG: GDP-mannose 4,6-dehydratase [Candidatus Pelagibacter sp. TMED64]|tara:strand:- start:6593 stop:7618 length:1026 start_codon:yes stop_codon:yes gene_type:complete
MKNKIALIVGITGQDGSYLADFLLSKGYQVHGLQRRASTSNTQNIEHLNLDVKTQKNVHLHYGDLTDSSSLNKIVHFCKPDEIYNIGAQSHVHTSFQMPLFTSNVNALGTIRLLDVIKNINPDTKFYQASTSELFGDALESPQTEKTPFNPRSPYAISKLSSFHFVKNYREAFKIFACNGILFNHESPRRGQTFVSRKITRAVAEIYKGNKEKIYLGNLNAKRDWGYAKEYVEAMWLMLQKKEPDDFIIATGKNYSVRDFVEKAFSYINIDLVWEGKDDQEKGINKKNNKVLVEIDPYYYRPTEVNSLVGDFSKAQKTLGWKPKVQFNELVEIMMRAELEK